MFPIQGAGKFTPGVTTNTVKTYAAAMSADIKGLQTNQAFSAANLVKITEREQALMAASLAGRTTGYGLGGATIYGLSVAAAYIAASLTANAATQSLSSFDIVNRVDAFAGLTADVESGDSLLLLIDVLSEALSEASEEGFVGITDINAELRINNQIVDLISFDYQEPEGRLGAILNARLGTLSPEDAPLNSSIDFDLIINESLYYPLIINGKLTGREKATTIAGGNQGGPKDELNISAIDVIADRFSRSPLRPVVMYDPAKVDYTQLETNPRDAIIDQFGRPILPILEPVGNLTMRQILNRAYTSEGGSSSAITQSYFNSLSPAVQANIIGPGISSPGIGFDAVITNIESYPVSRANFNIESSWHDGAEPCVAMFGPLYIPLNNRLMIWNIESPIPYGALPHIVSLDDHNRLNESFAPKADANQVLLTYQQQDTSNFTATRDVIKYSTDKPPVGLIVSDYLETRTQTKYRERYLISDPSVIVGEPLLLDETTTTYQSFNGVTLFASGRETQTNSYRGELKIGHIRKSEGIVAVGNDRSYQMRTIMEEECKIVWKQDPTNPGQQIQSRCWIYKKGLVYQASETIVRTNPATGVDEDYNMRYPVLVAQASGIIEEGDGAIQANVPIEATTMVLRRTKGNQYDYVQTTMDLLNNTQKYSSSTPITGDTYTDEYATRATTVRLIDQTSVNLIGLRTPVSVNAGELPRERALQLGNQVLYRLAHPLSDAPFSIPGCDLGIVKGSIILGQRRDGNYTNRLIVTGRGFAGKNLGFTGHRISMSLQTKELAS